MLYNDIEQAKKYEAYAELPVCISDNLNCNFELRSYQRAAFQNFVTYFENEHFRAKPSQTLFHMATGSGKTLIMAGLIIYLYQKGYRKFLFFVNSSNIVQKTKENFLNGSSNKYLFSDDIMIDGSHIPIKEVENFQSVDDEAINICFSTIQGLHQDMWFQKENSLTMDDFKEQKIVLISDEAHHLNVLTTAGKKKSKDEEENYHSWQETVEGIFESSVDNILLEFTATCDLDNKEIKAEYQNKIVFNYPLKEFRKDKYSKEIITLRSDLSIMDKSLQALMLSQYRLKIFQDNRLTIKPVLLFKSATINESKFFMQNFINNVNSLTGSEIERIRNTVSDNPTMEKAYAYFERNNISFDNLAQELKDDFSEPHCVSVNDEKEAEQKQILVNSLEDRNNPYRAVFEVKKLDEGWDVLNLFDIVRLYETRQSSGKRISHVTLAEAQLIGRGARYCPFQIDDEQSKYQRKYDDDVDNELRICETLHYHCQNDSRYIGELHHALEEIGLKADPQTFAYTLKPEFKDDELYKKGFLFVNERKEIPLTEVFGLTGKVRNKQYQVSLSVGASGEDVIMDDDSSNSSTNTHMKFYNNKFKISDIVNDNYNLVYKALMKYPVYKFKTLKSHLPNLKSMRGFIRDENYLGNIDISINSKYQNKEDLPNTVIFDAVYQVAGKIAEVIDQTEARYEGTKEFNAVRIANVIKDKTVSYNEIHEGGLGFSQNHISVDSKYKIDLSKENWFAFTENWGTSEEKAFVGYFRDYVSALQKNYDKIYLVRNERQFHLYSFDNGLRFEPDYIIFLWKNKKDGTDGYEQLQIFVEPKGTHLLSNDAWKEDFLLEIEEYSIPTIQFVDDNNYKILGFHFYNRNENKDEFDNDFQKIIDEAVEI